MQIVHFILTRTRLVGVLSTDLSTQPFVIIIDLCTTASVVD